MGVQDCLKISLSGFTTEEAVVAQNLIKNLGGTVLGGTSLHPECNCLVVNKLSRTEKVLSALAKALPILNYNDALTSGFFEKSPDEQIACHLELDWGSKEQKGDSIRISSFTNRQIKKQQFEKWRVGLFLNDKRKAGTYERILRDANAEFVIQIASPFQLNQDLSLHYVLSEPVMMEQDENFNEMVQKSGPLCDVKVLSYLVISEKLFRENHVRCDLFELSSAKVQDLHKTLGMNQVSSQLSTSSKNCSTPSIKNYFPVQPKTYSGDVVETINKRGLEVSLQKSPGNLLKRRAKFQRKDLSPCPEESTYGSDAKQHNLSVHRESEKSNIGPLELKTSLEKVGQFKTSQLYKICQESELCLRIHKKRNVGSEPEPLQVSFMSFFETYAENARETEEEQFQLWTKILYFLNSYVTFERYPNVSVLHTVFMEAVRDNCDVSIRRSAHSLLKRMIVYKHPPSSPLMRSHYLKSFIYRTNTPKDVKAEEAESFWDFVYDLMQRVVRLDKVSYNQFKDCGDVLLLDLVVFLFEVDLTFVIEEFLEKETKTLSSLLTLLLWPSGQIGFFSHQLRRILELYVGSVLADGKSVGLFRRMLNLASLVVALAEKENEKDENKNMISSFLANKLLTVQSRNFWRELNLIKSDWLSLLILYQTLNRIKRFDEISLRQFSNKILSIQQDEIFQESPSSQELENQTNLSDIEKSKGVKRNKYGETALHVACRNGNLAKVKEILKTGNININTGDHLGWTPLHEAVSHGQLECIKILLTYKPKTIAPFFKTSRNLRVHVDLEAEGGGSDSHGGINPLHDAVRCNQLEAAELILKAIILRKGRTKLLEMLEKTTKSGHNAFQLSCSVQMIDLLNKYKNDDDLCQNDGKLIIDCNINRFWLLTYMFLYKYSASFRLHSLKELMKSNPTYSHSDCPSTFNSGFDRKFCFDGYLLQRSSRVIAEDIRTFWSLNKNSKFHSVFVLTKKELFSP